MRGIVTTLAVIGAIALLTIGCGLRPGATAVPAPSPTVEEATGVALAASPTPTSTPTPLPPTPTSTTTATPTPEPTDTPTLPPTPTPVPPTPTATPTPGPKGKLVFQVASGGDIYIINADGTGLRRLTDGLDPAWSPDGTRVAFARWREPRGIYVIDADGQNERAVYITQEGKSPSWSPDGNRLVFTHLAFPPQGGLWKLVMVDLRDGTSKELACDPHSFSPAWSPDGERIAYDGDRGISITNDREGPSWNVVDEPRMASPAWSPDGSRMAYMFHQHDHWEIYVMNADGSGQTRLTAKDPFAKEPIHNVSPAWSPDGQQIAFLTNRNGRWEIYVMEADGSRQRRLFETALDGLELTYQNVFERVLSWTE
ncbi:MAG: hypothetical protein ACE5NP_04895 [Anaerolineae bacterium]